MSAIEEKITCEKNILPGNKKKIMEFKELCIARGLRPASITKELYSLWFIGLHARKQFLNAMLARDPHP